MFIANFSATMVTSLPSFSLSLCISLSLSLSHRKYLTHNIGSAEALPIIDCEEVQRDVVIVTTLTAHWLCYRFLYSRARALPFQIHCPLYTERVWRRNQSSKAGRKLAEAKNLANTAGLRHLLRRSNGRYESHSSAQRFLH